MMIIDLEQGTSAWHAWRSEGLGSSDVSAIAAHARLVEYKPWMKSVARVYEEKKGLRSGETFDSWRIRRGHAGEGFVRAAVADRLGQLFAPLCVQSDDQPMLRASLDGINFQRNHILEIKNPNDTVHSLAGAGVIVDYYLVQMLHQCCVFFGHPDTWTDELKMTFASGRPEDRSVNLVTASVLMYRPMAIAVYNATVDFIDCMANNRPPLGEDFMTRAARYAALQREIDALNEARNGIKDELVAELVAEGRTRASGGGISISWQEPRNGKRGFWRAAVSSSRIKEVNEQE